MPQYAVGHLNTKCTLVLVPNFCRFIRGEVESPGIVQPGQEKAQRKSYSCL